VLRTRVGYCGGIKPNPDYHDLKDHSETLQIQFDTSVVTYWGLLKIFWNRHDYAEPIEQQYKSAIFYHTEQQRQEAQASLELVKKGEWGQACYRGMAPLTAIQPATTFYIAELYHQKYFLQCNKEVFKLLQYVERLDLIDDPVATSINGYLHGSGSVDWFMGEVDTWPLPFAAKYSLLRHVAGGKLDDFKPIDEGQTENPLPGAFPVLPPKQVCSGGKCARKLGA